MLSFVVIFCFVDKHGTKFSIAYRLWDLGQQRCVHSYAVHTDSVWALASTPTFSHVYSGGRDLSVSPYNMFLRLLDESLQLTLLICVCCLLVVVLNRPRN